MNRAVWAAIAILIVLIGVRVVVGLKPQEDDRTAIRRVLSESIAASREGRPGGVMDKLSSGLKVNNEEAGSNLREVANFIKKQRPEIVVSNPNPIVTGDEARITSPVEMSVSFLGQTRNIHLKDVTLLFRREDARTFGVVPTKTWKLAEVTGATPSIADLTP